VAGKTQNRLALIRGSRGLSVAELAKRVGVIRQTIYAIETGSYVPNTEVALRLARELETPVEELFQLAEAAGSAGTEQVASEYLDTASPAKGQAVRTGRVGTKLISVPVSAAPYHLPEADGVVASIQPGEKQPKVHLFSRGVANSRRLIVAGCDPAASVLAHMVERIGGAEVIHAPGSSQLALDWLRAGHVHLAGTHLEDSKTGEFNLPFVRRQFVRQDMTVITFAEWEAGFVVAEGNPKAIQRIEDLAKKNVRFVNRETGSGSRSLLDKLLRSAGLSATNVRGYDRTVAGHLAAAYTVVSGEADCCIATQSAARAYSLDFVPLHRERYDFVLRRETLGLPQAKAFLDVLQRADLRRKLETLAGYDTTKTGVVLD
jgi:molybdate-binding protein/DNA-binding XRE family transcriptional regulator